jgi:Domain of unknown function (DUF4258)
MKYELSEHAASRMSERKIETAWLEEVITNPQRKEVDPDDPGMEHRLAAIAERELSCAPRGVRSEAQAAQNRHRAF